MMVLSLSRRGVVLLAALCLLLTLAGCNNRQARSTPVASPTSAAIPENAADPAGTRAAPNATAVGAETGPGGQPADPAPTPVTVSGTLLLWHSWAGDEGDALAQVLAAVKSQYPDLQLATLFVAPDDLLASYVEAAQAGGGPDLLLAPNWQIDQLARTNTLLPLDDQLAADLTEQYWPGALDSLRVDGTLYGLPMSYQTVALLVNTNLVDATALPSTTDEWLADARSAPTHGIGLYANLFHLAWGLPAYGATLFDDTGTVILDQSGGTAAFLTWLQTVNKTQGSYVNSDYGMLLDRFKKGEFAYLVDGPWALPELSAALGDALVVVPLPAGPAAPAQPWLYSDGLFVNASIAPDQQALALTVAQAMTTGAAASALATGDTLLPAARDVDLSAQPQLDGFAKQAATALAMPTRPEMDQVWGYGGDMLVKTLTGLTPPPAIVAETSALINEANGKVAADE